MLRTVLPAKMVCGCYLEMPLKIQYSPRVPCTVDSGLMSHEFGRERSNRIWNVFAQRILVQRTLSRTLGSQGPRVLTPPCSTGHPSINGTISDQSADPPGAMITAGDGEGGTRLSVDPMSIRVTKTWHFSQFYRETAVVSNNEQQNRFSVSGSVS